MMRYTLIADFTSVIIDLKKDMSVTIYYKKDMLPPDLFLLCCVVLCAVCCVLCCVLCVVCCVLCCAVCGVCGVLCLYWTGQVRSGQVRSGLVLRVGLDCSVLTVG